MILKRLYDLAVSAGLTADRTTKEVPIYLTVRLDAAGKFLDVIDRRDAATGRAPHGRVPAFAITDDGGESGRWRTAPSNTPGAVTFPSDQVRWILPVPPDPADPGAAEAERKCVPRRETFWRAARAAAGRTGDPTLAALAAFGESLAVPEVAAEVAAAVAGVAGRWAADDGARAGKNKKEAVQVSVPRATCSFSVGGKSVPALPAYTSWWHELLGPGLGGAAAGDGTPGVTGVCQASGLVAGIPETVRFKIDGKSIPGVGHPAGSYLVSGAGSSDTRGLKKAQARMVSDAGCDAVARAVAMLAGNRLPAADDPTLVGGVRSSFSFGGLVVLFWTRDRASTGAEAYAASPDEIHNMLDGVRRAVGTGAAVSAGEEDQYYLLVLSGSQARLVVRDYLEGSVGRFRRGVLSWFEDLAVAAESRPFCGAADDRFSMADLSAAVGGESSAAARLMSAAFTGTAPPPDVLSACLRRLRAAADKAFTAPRMGLIRLCLNRLYPGGVPLTPTLDPGRAGDVAYACGRLFACLALCQDYQSCGTQADIVARFFGSAMTSPRMTLPPLVRLNRHHVARLRDKSHYAADECEAGIDEITSSMPGDFPASLTLPEQGRFAMGYYHQRAAYRYARSARSAGPQSPPPGGGAGVDNNNPAAAGESGGTGGGK